MKVPSHDASPEEWRKAFAELPPQVQQAIFDHALSACPTCGPRGVPLSWAVVTAEALKKSS